MPSIRAAGTCHCELSVPGWASGARTHSTGLYSRRIGVNIVFATATLLRQAAAADIAAFLMHWTARPAGHRFDRPGRGRVGYGGAARKLMDSAGTGEYRDRHESMQGDVAMTDPTAEFFRELGRSGHEPKGAALRTTRPDFGLFASWGRSGYYCAGWADCAELIRVVRSCRNGVSCSESSVSRRCRLLAESRQSCPRRTTFLRFAAKGLSRISLPCRSDHVSTFEAMWLRPATVAR